MDDDKDEFTDDVLDLVPVLTSEPPVRRKSVGYLDCESCMEGEYKCNVSNDRRRRS